MAKFEIYMPHLGESITEATIIKFLKKVGENVNEDDSLIEIATDKVDSEIPSPVKGILIKYLYEEGTVVEVGKLLAIIETEGENVEETTITKPIEEVIQKVAIKNADESQKISPATHHEDSRFYSPLVKNMAISENISPEELETIKGSGLEGRLTKNDLLAYIENRNNPSFDAFSKNQTKNANQINFNLGHGDQVVEMDRMRQLIAQHMINSIQTSVHVTSFSEVDMGKVVNFRDAHKGAFLEKENEKLTYTPIIIHAVSKVLKEFPFINAAVDGKNIILKKNINIGMATALPTGNLIVPVIKNADEKDLLSIVKSVNDLAQRARDNKLLPDEIQGGTFTITNLGSFNTITGTPIINQPQVAILAIGVIKKRPVVVETELGDVIAIRPVMYLSLTFDHRIVDGALAGMFLDRVVKSLESYA